MSSLHQLSASNENIKYPQTKTPAIGTKGTSGVLKALGASGIFLRITKIPMHTKEKANRVPMLTICPKSLIGTNPAKILTKNIKKIFVFHGVRNLEWICPKNLGSNPSLLIE